MAFKGLFKNFWGKPENLETTDDIQDLPSIDDASFYRKSKYLLQRFDECITASEAEVETLSIELDNCIEQETNLEIQLKQLNKPNTWQERHLLLKLDRLQLHCSNLKRRIEIYSQNIRVYLALISQIQDMKAMRMFGSIDETKMESLCLDFNETLEKYKNLLVSSAATHTSEGVTVQASEDRLSKIRKSLFSEEKKSESKEEIKTRPSIETSIEAKNEKLVEKRMLLE